MLKNIYHGSEKIIECPKYGFGSSRNDYGKAFYTTEEIDLAREWSVERDRDGYVNSYALDMTDLKVLDLCQEEYSILNWLAILVDNRIFDIQSDFGAEALSYLKKYFLLDYEDFDVIIGYRADDSYFSFAQDFLNNVISIRTLSKAMQLGKLGKQVAIKSKRAFECIEYIQCEEVKSDIWYPRKEQRDSAARNGYFEMKNEPWKRGEVYIMSIIDEEIKPDDLRLRPDFT